MDWTPDYCLHEQKFWTVTQFSTCTAVFNLAILGGVGGVGLFCFVWSFFSFFFSSFCFCWTMCCGVWPTWCCFVVTVLTLVDQLNFILAWLASIPNTLVWLWTDWRILTGSTNFRKETLHIPYMKKNYFSLPPPPPLPQREREREKRNWHYIALVCFMSDQHFFKQTRHAEVFEWIRIDFITIRTQRSYVTHKYTTMNNGIIQCRKLCSKLLK